MSRTHLARAPWVAAALLISVLLPGCGRAQAHDHALSGTAEDARAGVDAAHGVHQAMTARATSSDPHLELTPHRAPSPADSTRAAKILSQLKQSLARYDDYRVAIADGYEPFLPNLPQPTYHFTNTRKAIKSAFTFAPDEPTSLLYEKTNAGYRLVGAMYTAPKRASLDDLDERVPLSIAQWHAHVNICVPRASERQRWRERSGGKMKFGPAGAIATEAECDREGGRWFPQLFGWMVHVNPYESDPAKVWGTHGSGSHGSGGSHHDH